MRLHVGVHSMLLQCRPEWVRSQRCLAKGFVTQSKTLHSGSSALPASMYAGENARPWFAIMISECMLRDLHCTLQLCDHSECQLTGGFAALEVVNLTLRPVMRAFLLVGRLWSWRCINARHWDAPAPATRTRSRSTPVTSLEIFLLLDLCVTIAF